jgi:hypothetical protein
MRFAAAAVLVSLLILSASVEAQPSYVRIKVNRISRQPAGVLEKALAGSMLEQPNARPFHLRLDLEQTKGPPGDYRASIEEVWYSPTRWVRTVRSAHFTQSVTMDDTGRHVQRSGDYFPLWLRSFVTAISTPVPDNLRALYNDDPLKPHAYDASGNAADLCQEYEIRLGPSSDMTNLGLVCFKPDNGLLIHAYEPGYAMSYEDYVPFNNLQVARTLRENVNYGDYIEITGRIAVLENIDPSAARSLEPPTSNAAESFTIATLSMTDILSLSGGMPHVTLPHDLRGHGKINTWINIDPSGNVREITVENYDADYRALKAMSQLVGRQWKPYFKDGRAMQAQGPIVFSY